MSDDAELVSRILRKHQDILETQAHALAGIRQGSKANAKAIAANERYLDRLTGVLEKQHAMLVEASQMLYDLRERVLA
ncbi:MAG: hypothetical protein OXG38_01235 [Chloroflexi bacterium]|nr:hypothetical protein [Chloroflexota bacterium]